MDRDDSKFLLAAEKEQFAFKQLCNKYNLFSENDGYSIDIPTNQYSSYDLLIQHFPDNSYISDKRFIVELKVRNVSNHTLVDCKENGWVLEKSKFDSLMKVNNLDPDKNRVLYISFVNDKTLIWDLIILEKKGKIKWISKGMNVASMVSTTDKKSKKVCLLSEEDAKEFKYVYDDLSFERNRKTRKEELKSIRREDTKSTGVTISDILFGSNHKYNNNN